MNPLVMAHSDAPSSDIEEIKREAVQPDCPDITIWHLNLFGSYLHPDRPLGLSYTMWYYFMSCCFVGYFLFFLVFGTLDFIYSYDDYFWILYLTMLIKCMLLRRSIFEIRGRLNSSQFSDTIAETANVVNSAKRYFFYAVAANMTAILFYDIVWIAAFFSIISIGISLMFLLGTVVFSGYMSTIILFCLADTRFAQKEVQSCISLARLGQLTPAIYSETQRKIDFVVKNSFWIDGAMLIFILVNTVSAIVLLLTYDRFLGDYPVLLIVSFILYVLVVMWAVDAAFLLFIVPEIAEVNESFSELHLVLAESKFESNDAEISRYDTLHLLTAKPIRYLIAGFHLTRSSVRSRVIGIILTMFFFLARMIVLLILQK